jgi:AraC family transcriptional regulator
MPASTLEKCQDVAALPELYAGKRRARLTWPELQVEYAWLGPFEGFAVTKPNRIEVVFSEHLGVIIENDNRLFDINVEGGGTYLVGASGTRLHRVSEYSDTLEMYPSLDLMVSHAEELGVRSFEIEPTLQGAPQKQFRRDPLILPLAHVLRRVCVDQISLTPLEASSIAHMVAWRIVEHQSRVHNHAVPRNGTGLSAAILRLACDYIEENLSAQITLADIANHCCLSPWHFSKLFHESTGMAPYQFALSRRIERAKHQLMTTDETVCDVAWDLGFENLSHFRRQFRK